MSLNTHSNVTMHLCTYSKTEYLLSGLSVALIYDSKDNSYISKLFKDTFHIYKPRHGIVLQSTVSNVLPTQLFPPQDGVGLLQLLVFFLTPPSHDFEHFPIDQFDQPPSTIQK